MAGELHTFLTGRPGIDQGRNNPDNFTVNEGDFLFTMGSDTPGRVGWFKLGDTFDLLQSDTPAAVDKIVRFRGKWRGPTSGMPAVSAEVGPPNWFVLADAQTLILSIDGGSNQTITYSTGDFADITKALPGEVVSTTNTQLTGATATSTGFGQMAIHSDTNAKRSRVQVIGGTATALTMVELGWRISMRLDNDVLVSRILKTGEEQDLSDMAVNLAEYTTPPTELKFRLEVIAV